jgi:hypothetical protein
MCVSQTVLPAEPYIPKNAYDFAIVPPGPFAKPVNPRKRKNTSDFERQREAQREAEAQAAAHAAAQATIATTIPTAADGAAADGAAAIVVHVEVPAVSVDDDSDDAEEEEEVEEEDDDDDVDLLAASRATNEITVNVLNVKGTKVVAGEAHFIKLDKGAPNGMFSILILMSHPLLCSPYSVFH